MTGGKFSGCLICTDYDGTFCRKAGEVSKENCDAVAYFQANGGLFTVASGRFPRNFIGALEREGWQPNTYAVCLNGTVIYDLEADAPLRIASVEPDPTELLRSVWAQMPYINTLVIHDTYRCASAKRAEDETLDRIFAELPGPWRKVVFRTDEEHTDFLYKTMTERWGDVYNFGRSWRIGLEMQGKNSSKGICVKDLRELVGGIHTLICVGDYENDESMVRAADIGYAVGNAVDSLKKAADRVTCTNQEHAIAAIIADLERDIDSGAVPRRR